MALNETITSGFDEVDSLIESIQKDIDEMLNEKKTKVYNVHEGNNDAYEETVIEAHPGDAEIKTIGKTIGNDVNDFLQTIETMINSTSDLIVSTTKPEEDQVPVPKPPPNTQIQQDEVKTKTHKPIPKPLPNIPVPIIKFKDPAQNAPISNRISTNDAESVPEVMAKPLLSPKPAKFNNVIAEMQKVLTGRNLKPHVNVEADGEIIKSPVKTENPEQPPWMKELKNKKIRTSFNGQEATSN